jgi:hypothetical protein
VSQPEQPPRFFVDRSLGRRAVPEALRAGGWDLITLAEHYGMPADEQIAIQANDGWRWVRVLAGGLRSGHH